MAKKGTAAESKKRLARLKIAKETGTHPVKGKKRFVTPPRPGYGKIAIETALDLATVPLPAKAATKVATLAAKGARAAAKSPAVRKGVAKGLRKGAETLGEASYKTHRAASKVSKAAKKAKGK